MIAPTDKQLKLFVQVNNSVLAHLEYISIAIVGLRNGEPYEFGSGTCVEIAGRYFIATAHHVVAAYGNNELFLILQHDAQQWTPMLLGRGGDDALDVAWLELPVEIFEAGIDRRFISHTRLLPNRGHVNEDVAVVHGFPRRLLEPQKVHRGLQGLSVQPLCFGSSTLDPSPINDSVADRDIYLDYPKGPLTGSDGHPAVPIEAPGLSGGGIWIVDANKKGVWSPESCRLIGIQHSWMEWKWVRGTQIQHWISLVARDLPELAPALGVTRGLARG